MYYVNLNRQSLPNSSSWPANIMQTTAQQLLNRSSNPYGERGLLTGGIDVMILLATSPMKSILERSHELRRG